MQLCTIPIPAPWGGESWSLCGIWVELHVSEQFQFRFLCYCLYKGNRGHLSPLDIDMANLLCVSPVHLQYLIINFSNMLCYPKGPLASNFDLELGSHLRFFARWMVGERLLKCHPFYSFLWLYGIRPQPVAVKIERPFFKYECQSPLTSAIIQHTMTLIYKCKLFTRNSYISVNLLCHQVHW